MSDTNLLPNVGLGKACSTPCQSIAVNGNPVSLETSNVRKRCVTHQVIIWQASDPVSLIWKRSTCVLPSGQQPGQSPGTNASSLKRSLIFGLLLLISLWWDKFASATLAARTRMDIDQTRVLLSGMIMGFWWVSILKLYYE